MEDSKATINENININDADKKIKNSKPEKYKASFMDSLKNNYVEFQKVQQAPSKFKGRLVKGNLIKNFNNQPQHLTCEYCGKEVDKLIFNSHSETHPTKILEWIYLGSYNNALNKEDLQRINVKYILNCALECKNMFIDDFTYKKLLMTDTPKTKLSDFFSDALEFIETARINNSKILIHCQLGKSRSSSILIAYFIKYLGYELESAYTYIKNKRKVVFPNLSFMNELKVFSKLIQNNKMD